MSRRNYLPGCAGPLAVVLAMAASASAEPLPLRAELWHSEGSQTQMDGISAGARIADLGVVQVDVGRRQFAAGGESSKMTTVEWRPPQVAGPQWSLRASDEHLAAERIRTLQLRFEVRF